MLSMSKDNLPETVTIEDGGESTDIDILQTSTGNPYREINFLGTYLATALGAVASYGGYVMLATSLTYINDDIGPSDNITWVSLAWTLTLAVGYTLVGRLSDLFGRRWFFIGSSALATIGCIVGATAKTVNQVIGANVLLGLAAASQLSFSYVLGELVPMKHRFGVFSGMFVITVPIAGFGPYFARLFIAHTVPGWRWCFYMSIIINGTATIAWFLFYHPPNFGTIHRNRSKWQEVKDIDFVGIFLFTGGLLLFLMGLSWGGESYPWKSAHVIVTMCVGFVLCVAFILYEIYVPLRRPLVPMHLFKNQGFAVLNILAGVGGMLYYSMNVIFPTMVMELFTTDIVYGGLLSSVIGAGVVLGQITGCLIAVPGGFIRAKLIITAAVMVTFIGAMAGAVHNKSMAIAFATLGSVGVGALESIANGLITIVIEDQTELGIGIGVYGSVRSAAGVLATAIYVTILNNKVSQYTESLVVPAVEKAGLPQSSVASFLTALSSGSSQSIEAVQGVNDAIIAIGTEALKEAYAQSFKIVFLASLSFGGIAFIASFWAPNAKGKLTLEVVRRLAPRGSNEKVLSDSMEEKSGSEVPTV